MPLVFREKTCFSSLLDQEQSKRDQSENAGNLPAQLERVTVSQGQQGEVRHQYESSRDRAKSVKGQLEIHFTKTYVPLTAFLLTWVYCSCQASHGSLKQLNWPHTQTDDKLLEGNNRTLRPAPKSPRTIICTEKALSTYFFAMAYTFSDEEILGPLSS